MSRLCVISLATGVLCVPPLLLSLVLVVPVSQYGWTMCSVLALSPSCQAVTSMDGGSTTVHTMRMLVSSVLVCACMCICMHINLLCIMCMYVYSNYMHIVVHTQCICIVYLYVCIIILLYM